MRGRLRPAGLLLLAVLAVQGPNLPARASAPSIPIVHRIKAVDADNHTIVVNRPGMVTLLLCTNEDSQDAAREAGRTVYPLRGRPDFQLVVVVDLRDSIATWVPSIVMSQLRQNLDREAVLLKPYYLKNGNRSNPRATSYVIADFGGTICPKLGWPEGSGHLRGILFNGRGHEIKRWDRIDRMDGMLADVWSAVRALDESREARAAEEVKPESTKTIQPPSPPRPLPPIPTNGAPQTMAPVSVPDPASGKP